MEGLPRLGDIRNLDALIAAIESIKYSIYNLQ